MLAQLPLPTQPNLVRLGYYFVDGRYGDDRAQVWPYTNLYIAIPDGYLSGTDWQSQLAASMQTATVNHKAIYLILTTNANFPTMTFDTILDVAKNYWGQVAYVDVWQEPATSTTSTQMEQRIASVRTKMNARGLATRPFAATFTAEASLITNAIAAASLNIVTIEAYLPAPGDADPQVNIDLLNSRLATGKSRAHNAGKQIILVMQAYDRNGTWTNLTTLEALQRPVYLNAYADPDVLGIMMFSFNRPGGSKDWVLLQQAHREIGSVMNVSPAMYIDTPLTNTVATQPFHIQGWAIDRATAGTDTGIDTLHVWATPVGGGSAIFLGAAAYGGIRPDVGAAYGAQFTPSGYALGVSALAPGTYDITVFPHSTVSSQFVGAKVIRVTVQ